MCKVGYEKQFHEKRERKNVTLSETTQNKRTFQIQQIDISNENKKKHEFIS